MGDAMRSPISRGLVAALIATMLVAPATAGAAPRPAPAGRGPATAEDWKRLERQQVPKQAPSDAVLSGQAVPRGANPYPSLLPDAGKVDWAYWQEVARARGQARARQQAAAATTTPLVYNEVEPAAVQGQNDTKATAEFVKGFGTGGRRNNPAAQLAGTLSTGTRPRTVVPSAEDDGAIPLANETGLGGGPGRTVTDATIGDGTHGSAGTGTGDFDYFKITGATAGQTLVADIDTPTSDLDSVVALLDSQGLIVGFNDNDERGLLDDSLMTVTIPAP